MQPNLDATICVGSKSLIVVQCSIALRKGTGFDINKCYLIMPCLLPDLRLSLPKREAAHKLTACYLGHKAVPHSVRNLTKPEVDVSRHISQQLWA